MNTAPPLPFLLLSSSLLLLTAIPGCGGPPSVESVCDACGGTEAQHQECLRHGNADLSFYTKQGCGAEFQALVDCIADNLVCVGGSPQTSPACEAASGALDACEGD